jgi:hypothetical protein
MARIIRPRWIGYELPTRRLPTFMLVATLLQPIFAHSPEGPAKGAPVHGFGRVSHLVNGETIKQLRFHDNLGYAPQLNSTSRPRRGILVRG